MDCFPMRCTNLYISRGQDGWMASPTQWTWVWESSGRWWRTGKPGVLQSIWLQSQTGLSNWTRTPPHQQCMKLPLLHILVKTFAIWVGVASHCGFNLQFPLLMRLNIFSRRYWPSLFSLQWNVIYLFSILPFGLLVFFLAIIEMLYASGAFVG